MEQLLQAVSLGGGRNLYVCNARLGFRVRVRHGKIRANDSGDEEVTSCFLVQNNTCFPCLCLYIFSSMCTAGSACNSTSTLLGNKYNKLVGLNFSHPTI